MNYPLRLRFKIVTLASKVSVTDNTGALMFFAKQKLFKFKEAIQIFGDEEQTQLKYTINADRVIDFSANYQFADAQGAPMGSVRRRGMKSLWRARYEIAGMQAMTITEENPWTKFFDGLLKQVPLISMFSGYFLHPSYIVKNAGGQEIMRLKKEPAFLEGLFSIEKLNASLDPKEETMILLSLLMMVLLERVRG